MKCTAGNGDTRGRLQNDTEAGCLKSSSRRSGCGDGVWKGPVVQIRTREVEAGTLASIEVHSMCVGY